MDRLFWYVSLNIGLLPISLLAGGPHYCERPATNHCQNGATCVGYNGNYNYYCECVEGYEGVNCQYINCTSPVWCINGGTCNPINGNTSKDCTCYYGWKGDNCEFIDECTPHVQADIVFAIDVSESEGHGTFIKQKEFVKNFVSKFRVGPLNYRYQFAVVTYSMNAVVHFHLDTYQNDTDLQSAIDNIEHDENGPTMTGEALRVIREQVLTKARNSVAKYVIVLTDGLSSNITDTQQQARALQDNSINVMAIGVGKNVYHKELLDIAGRPRHVFSMHNTDALYAILDNSMAGCQDCTTLVSDVAVLMDVTSHIGYRNFDDQLKATETLMKMSTVGTTGLQFSATTFSDSYTTVFDLDKHTSSSEMIVDINKNIRRDEGQMFGNPTTGLNYIKLHGFSQSQGARSSARKVLVIVSSGHFENTTNLLLQIQDLKNDGITIVSIGTDRNVNITLLQEIASDPALTYVVGDDAPTDDTALYSLLTTFEYEYCSNI